MKRIEVLLLDIERKIYMLIQDKTSLEQEKEALKKQVSELSEINQKQEDVINELEEKLKTQRISQSLLAIDDKNQVNQRIDELVRDIDQSIKLLHQLNK